MQNTDTSPSCPISRGSSGKREQILNGAETVFGENGYEGASMSLIARQAGVSKGTLYNYFQGKEELFTAFVREKTEQALPTAFKAFNADLPPDQTLHALARSIIGILIAPTPRMLYRIIIAEAERFPHLAQTLWEHGPRVSIDALARWLTDRTVKGELRVEDPVLAAEQFYSLCMTRIVNRSRLRVPVSMTDNDIQRVADAAVSMFLAEYAVR